MATEVVLLLLLQALLQVNETGFYYFIFANENEITDNFLSATFDMRKTVFDVVSAQVDKVVVFQSVNIALIALRISCRLATVPTPHPASFPSAFGPT